MGAIYVEPINAEGKPNAARVFLEDGTEITNIAELKLEMAGEAVSTVTLKLFNVILRNCTKAS